MLKLELDPNKTIILVRTENSNIFAALFTRT